MHTATMRDVTEAIASEYGWWLDDLNMLDELDGEEGL